jgi:hypothetical protein
MEAQDKARLDEMLENAADTLARGIATLSAQQLAMRALIATHPEPGRLHDVWQANKPQWVEAEMVAPHFQVEDFRETFLDVLGQLTRDIEAASAARRR